MALGTARNNKQAENQGQGTHGEDDGPHADAPFPGAVLQHELGNVTAHPGVDDEGQSGDVAEEETRTGRGYISNNDFDEQNNHGVANLVQNTAARKSVDIVGGGLDDGAEDVEEDGQANELDAAKDVGNLGGRGLGAHRDDRPDDIDGGCERMLAKRVGGRGLVGVAEGAVEAVGVCDEEDAQEDEDSVAVGGDGGDGLDTRDARGCDVLDGVGSGGW